jgi:hypothetical protein
MKQIFFAIVFSMIVFSACKKSNTEEIVPAPTGFQWPAGTGEYAPYTNGSTFIYESASGTPTVIDSFTYTVIKDTSIGGLNFKKLESNKPALGPTYYANYNAGVVTNISYNVNFQGLVTVPIVKQTVLKDNVPVATNWNDTLTISSSGFTVPVIFANTVTQKDYVKTILSKDYAGTIYVKQTASIPANIAAILGIPASTQIDNYFAKGVGLVQKDAVAAGTAIKIKRYNVIK